MDSSKARWPISTRRLAVCLATVLAGCGGGVFIGVDGSFDDSPPSVNLTAGTNAVQAGQALQVFAAAADESGIDSVAFYRFDGNRAVLLGSDGREPYEWQLVVPNDGRSMLTLFARATDNAGNRADSALVSVTVLP